MIEHTLLFVLVRAERSGAEYENKAVCVASKIGVCVAWQRLIF